MVPYEFLTKGNCVMRKNQFCLGARRQRRLPSYRDQYPKMCTPAATFTVIAGAESRDFFARWGRRRTEQPTGCARRQGDRIMVPELVVVDQDGSLSPTAALHS
jgi:hypothetical protein